MPAQQRRDDFLPIHKAQPATTSLVVLTAYSGGGSGVSYTLNILDAAWASAFDDDGTTYQRLDLTLLRRVALGDRWQGEIEISGNSIHVVTTGSLSAQDMKPKDVEA